MFHSNVSITTMVFGYIIEERCHEFVYIILLLVNITYIFKKQNAAATLTCFSSNIPYFVG